MKSNELLDSLDHVTPLAVEECGLHYVHPNTTLIVVRGMILAHTFPVCVTTVKATINQDVKEFALSDAVSPQYLPWLLRGAAPLFLSLTERSAHGTLALRTDRFMNEKLPIPPVDEQLEIVEHLEAERRRFDNLAQLVILEIASLEELRTSTITEAITGGLAVHGQGASMAASKAAA